MTSTTSSGWRPVHPVADLFPMLPDDELADLAADITERGLLQPIVLDKDGCILDGRNRRAACQLAGIEPTFTTYDGDDPDGYALAVNITRRHLTTGSRAMIAAKAERLGSKFATDDEDDDKLSKHRLYEARLVLDWCDAVTVNSVIVGDFETRGRRPGGEKSAAPSGCPRLARSGRRGSPVTR